MRVPVTDPALLAQLEQAGDQVIELTNPAGRVIGVFATDGLCKPPPGFKLPFSDEEVAELRKQRTGRPLAEVLRDLKDRG